MSSGVLITAFGGPRSLDEIGPFIETMTGRPVSDEVLERSKAKYASIGGRSPLPEIAEGIARALESELDRRGESTPVRLGMRYATPTIDEAVGTMAAEGIRTLVSLSLSPFESEITTQAYRQAVDEAASSHAVRVVETSAYHTHPRLVEAHASALQTALSELGAERPFVLFSAHSLPCEEMDRDDTYVRQLAETADLVARAAGLAAGSEGSAFDGVAPSMSSSEGTPWAVGYQSRGYRKCAWLEPELEELLQAASAAGYDGVVVSPVGFVTDHMETRYDLDIVARREAEDAGLVFVRADVPNAEPRLIEAFADTVMTALPE